MLNIIIGRNGSGKTNSIMEKVRANAEKGVQGQIIIVPEQYSHEMERALCRVCGDEISRYAEVLSFTRLSNRLMSQVGGLAVQSLDQGGRLLNLCAALEQVRDRLTVYRAPSNSAGFLENLMSALDEFKSYGVGADKLSKTSEKAEGSLSGKLKDLSLILDAYDAVMQQGKADPRDRIVMLAEGISSSAYMRGRHVFIDGFSDFTGVEMKVIEAILLKAESVTAALTCDTADDDGQEVFCAERETISQLVRIAGRLDLPWDINTLEPDGSRLPELEFLDKCLFSADGGVYRQPCPAIVICEREDRLGECRWIAGQIKKLVCDHRYRYRDIAVSAGAAREYMDVLECVFEEYEIPVYVSSMTDIAQKPVIKCVLSALEAVTSGFEYENMFSYLKTGLSNITAGECDLLENYVIRWSIRGGVWSDTWSFHPRGFGLTVSGADAELLAQLNEIREKVMAPLLELKDSLAKSKDVAGQLRALYAFLERLELGQRLEQITQRLHDTGDSVLAEEYAQLWGTLCGVLDQFYQTMGHLQKPADELPALLRLVVAQYDVGAIPVSLDSVTAGDIFRMRHRNVKCLFVAGATFDALPAAVVPSGLITEDEREALKHMGIRLAPGARDRLDSEMSAIYSTVTAAKDLLYISWPKLSARGEELTVSFIVRRLEQMFAQLHRLEGLSDDDSLYASGPAFRLAALGPVNEHAAAAACYFRDDSEAAKKLDRITTAAAVRQEALSGDMVKKLYGQKPKMSATRLEKFNACNFAFFMKYGLKAVPREKSGFEAPEYGAFIHYILENVARSANETGGFSQLSREDIRRLTDQYVSQYIRDVLGGLENKTDRFRYLFRRLKRAVYSVVENAAAELAASDFKPIAFELAFSDENGDMPAIEIGEGDSRMSLSGFVDRVDGYFSGGKLYVRVVDYKTGHKAFDLTEIWHGMGLQMLIYLFAVKKHGEAVFGDREIVPAGVLYFPAREVIVQADRGMTEEEIESLRGRELRRSGLILDDGDIISAMERFADGGPQYIPVKLNKDRRASGSLASARQLGKLGRHVDRTLARIASELSGGKVEINPYYRSSALSACDYCEFSDACHLDAQTGAGRPRYFYNMPQDEFWAALEENGDDQADG